MWYRGNAGGILLGPGGLKAFWIPACAGMTQKMQRCSRMLPGVWGVPISNSLESPFAKGGLRGLGQRVENS
jgi:hypothetical protein